MVRWLAKGPGTELWLSKGPDIQLWLANGPGIQLWLAKGLGIHPDVPIVIGCSLDQAHLAPGQLILLLQ